MAIYYIILLIIVFLGLFTHIHRKSYIVIAFGMIIIMAALRKYTIGIDLELHYANNFEKIAQLAWNNLSTYVGGTGYDIGFVIFCKLLSYISADCQCLIVATSVITFGSMGRFIYKYSDDVVTDSVMVITSFLMFMYMNIIAQALAVAIILFGIDFLAEKKYVRFVLVVLLATTIHTTAIICLIFIPLSILKPKLKYVFIYVLACIALVLGFSYLLPILTKTFFSQYYWYLEGSIHGNGVSVSAFSIYNITIHLIPIMLSVIFLYLPGRFNQTSEDIGLETNCSSLSGYLETNFLLYMSITALVCRILLYNTEVVARFGYYFYIFSFLLTGRAISSISDGNSRLQWKLLIYLYLIVMFVLFGVSAGTQSYGVVPYQFYWN